MDKSKLDDALKELESLLKTKTKVKISNYSAPERVKKAAKNPDAQRMWHRDLLLTLVIVLSSLSFLFLVCIISFQMWKKLSYPDYVGVSDTVINIVAVSVFAQVIAVVATIARIVFKDK